MAYAILRTAKLKTAGNIGGASMHNTRALEEQGSNADPARAGLNRYSKNKNANDAVKARIDEIYQGTGKKPRKNAVPAIEVLVTASPDFFEQFAPGWEKGKSQDKIGVWGQAQIEFIKKEFAGKVNIAQWALHLDESTPHMHFIVVPEKEGKLNCREYLGGRDKLGKLQDRYAAEMGKFGLERGLEGSKARHVPPKQNNASVARDSAEAFKRLEAVTEEKDILNSPGNLFKKAEAVTAPVIVMNDENRHVLMDSMRSASQGTFASQEMARRGNSAVSEAKKLERRNAADLVRDIPLTTIAEDFGLQRAMDDKSKWKTAYQTFSIGKDERVFNDVKAHKGGRGAIDFVMAINDCDFNQALGLLRDRYDDLAVADSMTRRERDMAQQQVRQVERVRFVSPKPEPKHLARVKDYLVNRRGIDADLVQRHIEMGVIYADKRANAVFLGQHGAELVGTGDKRFKGLAAGSSKVSLGFIAEPVPGYCESVGGLFSNRSGKALAIAESAIDALSYAQVKGCAAMSSAGAPDRGFFSGIRDWVNTRFEYIKSAFDNDKDGNRYAEVMDDAWRGDLYPAQAKVRDVPPEGLNDWNEYVQKYANPDLEFQSIADRLKAANQEIRGLKPENAPDIEIEREQ